MGNIWAFSLLLPLVINTIFESCSHLLCLYNTYCRCNNIIIVLQLLSITECKSTFCKQRVSSTLDFGCIIAEMRKKCTVSYWDLQIEEWSFKVLGVINGNKFTQLLCHIEGTMHHVREHTLLQLFPTWLHHSSGYVVSHEFVFLKLQTYLGKIL